MKDSEVTDVICRILGDLDGWNYLESPGVHPPDDVAVFYGGIGDKPDRAVGVRVYGGSDPDEDEGPASRRVQLHMRGGEDDPAGADDLADDAKSALHGLSRRSGISSISRQSMSSLGTDGNRRAKRTDNYLIIFDNPEAST